jgi:Rrf2 family transcriptional regulator, nitric oxide-sensitive transcriptional repressor
MPITENITHTAKFTAKASVFMLSTRICSRLYPGLVVVTAFSLVTIEAPSLLRYGTRRSHSAAWSVPVYLIQVKGKREQTPAAPSDTVARRVAQPQQAGAYGISKNHLTKIVHHLAQQGYIETVRGKGGGMRLARAPHRINLGDVVRDAEGSLAIVECFRGGNRCPVGPVCALRGLLESAAHAFFDVLDRRTLADLIQPQVQFARMLRRAPPGDSRGSSARP